MQLAPAVDGTLPRPSLEPAPNPPADCARDAAAPNTADNFEHLRILRWIRSIVIELATNRVSVSEESACHGCTNNRDCRRPGLELTLLEITAPFQ